MAQNLDTGLWSVLPTPFHGANFEIDHSAVRRLAEGLSEMRILRGLVVLGVFGESARLDPRERVEVLTTVRSAVDLPLVVGITGTDTGDCADSARELVAAGGGNVRAVMVQINSAESEQLRAHLDAVHRACGTGVVVQDYPAMTGVTITPTTLAGVVNALPYVVAVKSEAPPTGAVIAELAAQVQVPVFGGLGGLGLLDELLAGAAGAMTGFSYPEAIANALAAWGSGEGSGDFAAARASYAPWLPLVNFEAQPQIGLAIRKRIWAARGFISDAAVRPPAATFPPALEPILAAHLAAVPTLAQHERVT